MKLDPQIKAALSKAEFTATRGSLARLDAAIESRFPDEREQLERAVALMCQVHLGQKRPLGEPYLDHTLGVALNLLDIDAQVSASSVIAALLHDSIEDQPGQVLEFLDEAGARRQALKAIAADSRLGTRVSQMVASLTNPLPQPNQNKNQVYREHVVGLIDTDSDAFLIKLADFGENAFQLGNLPEGPKKQKLRGKYGPVILAVEERLAQLAPEHPLRTRAAAICERLREVYAADYQSAYGEDG